MPTIMTINSVKYCIYFDDHGKAHVHVIKNENEAKIEIGSGLCVAVNGFTKRDVKEIQKIIKKHKELFLKAWEDYNE